MRRLARKCSLAAPGRRRLALLALLSLPVLVSGAATAQAPEECALFIHLPTASLQVDLLGGQLPLLAPYLDRLVVTIADGGHTAFPTRSEVFAPAPGVGAADFAQVIQMADEAGIEVYAHVDLWNWVDGSEAGEQDLFATTPDLFLVDHRGESPHAGYYGRYASPLHPQVQACVTDLVREVAERYPELNGLLLEPRLSSAAFYNEAPRLAYVRQRQMDPLDIASRAPQPGEPNYWHEWLQWRLDCITQYLRQLRAAIHELKPDLPVALLAHADAYRWRLEDRGRLGQDWRAWVRHGCCDELVLDGHWTRRATKDSYAAALKLLSQAQEDLPHAPMLKSDLRQVPLDEQWQVVAPQADNARVVLRCQGLADVPKALRFFLLTVGEVE